MTVPFYEPLSFLDSSFLALETRSTHMHVAGIVIFEAGPMKSASGGIDIERIKAHIESKLQYIPRYRQRLGYIPYNRSPVWVVRPFRPRNPRLRPRLRSRRTRRSPRNSGFGGGSGGQPGWIGSDPRGSGFGASQPPVWFAMRLWLVG